MATRISLKPGYFSEMTDLIDYITRSAPKMLEIGACGTLRPGWFSTDLNARPGVMAMDATKPFPIPRGSFDFIYSEHMIEHISFNDGQNMLRECHRILKPGGRIRIVTPSLGFLLRVIGTDAGELEKCYMNWSIAMFVPEAKIQTPAVFINNFVRAWGHTFIYDEATLAASLSDAGFTNFWRMKISESDVPEFRNLESVNRLPPGFLELESMIIEAQKL